MSLWINLLSFASFIHSQFFCNLVLLWGGTKAVVEDRGKFLNMQYYHQYFPRHFNQIQEIQQNLSGKAKNLQFGPHYSTTHSLTFQKSSSRMPAFPVLWWNTWYLLALAVFPVIPVLACNCTMKAFQNAIPILSVVKQGQPRLRKEGKV